MALNDVGDVAIVTLAVIRPLLAHVEVSVFLHALHVALPVLLGFDDFIFPLFDECLASGGSGRVRLTLDADRELLGHLGLRHHLPHHWIAADRLSW